MPTAVSAPPWGVRCHSAQSRTGTTPTPGTAAAGWVSLRIFSPRLAASGLRTPSDRNVSKTYVQDSNSGCGQDQRQLLVTAGGHQETDDEFVVEADLPGVRPDDVTIDLDGKELHIGGEYGAAEQGDGDTQRVRRNGRFDYRLTLPDGKTAEATRSAS